MELIPKNGICTEVGVAFGDFSDVILKTINPKKFHAIDTFPMTYEYQAWNLKRLKETDTHESFYSCRFAEHVEKGIVELNKGISWEVIKEFPDNYFDFAYIDAGHTYEEVKKDIDAIFPKMKSGSYIQFNDYIFYDYLAKTDYGVMQAVNEFVVENNFSIAAYCLSTSGFDDILVKLEKAAD